MSQTADSSLAAAAPAEETSGSHPEPERRSGVRLCCLSERYELVSYLDSGGTADVFIGLDRDSGTEVAIKILRPESNEDSRIRHYFLQGARGAQRVRHPNLVRIFAVEEPPNALPFAAMELVDGKPLWALLANNGTLAPRLTVQLLRQAAEGLAAAHQTGLIHCDVKPENLLVKIPDHGTPELKVIDFDLAAIEGEPELHEHPLLRGTAKYMSPEQVLGDPVDARTDVYSLGVVLFRALTGHLPFDLELSPTLLFHQFASKAPPPSWLCEDLDPRLEKIVLKALRKAPEQRYADMEQLVLDLDALERGLPLLAEKSESEPDIYRPQTAGAVDAAKAIKRCV